MCTEATLDKLGRLKTGHVRNLHMDQGHMSTLHIIQGHMRTLHMIQGHMKRLITAITRIGTELALRPLRTSLANTKNTKYKNTFE